MWQSILIIFGIVLFCILGAFIIAALMSLPVYVLVFTQRAWRVYAMGKLAAKFGLDFKSIPSPYGPFSAAPIGKDIVLNTLEGNIGSHSVKVSDIFHSKALRFWNYGRGETLIYVDGQVVKGNLKNLTLGSGLYLTSIFELNKYLQSLKLR